jgi:hypothetical protein
MSVPMLPDRDLASRAKTRFAVRTPGWVKADDIIAAKMPGKNRVGATIGAATF